jgi:competence transcription factor ComK
MILNTDTKHIKRMLINKEEIGNIIGKHIYEEEYEEAENDKENITLINNKQTIISNITSKNSETYYSLINYMKYNKNIIDSFSISDNLLDYEKKV